MWTISAGTKIGPHHELHGSPNQDSHFHQIVGESSIAFLAVADGAGSLASSHMGSALAIEVAGKTVAECLESEPNDYLNALEESIASARQALLEHELSSELGCTLTLALAGELGWAVGTVGDSFAVVSEETGVFTLVSAPKASEYSNITKLLTSKDHDPFYSSGARRPAALAVATDGLEQSTLKNGEPLPGFWTPLMSLNLVGELQLEDLFEHMGSKDLITDDTSAVVASWSES